MDEETQTASPPISDTAAMHQALRCARRAAEEGEVPVGAVVVHQGRIVGTGHNTPVADHDPSAHAEINAMREAARRLGNYRLQACTLYVTLEPCAMCAGAILNARMDRVVFAAHDPRAGAAGSVVDLFADPQLNHRTHVKSGLLAEEARAMLQAFFRARRSPNAQPLREDALRTPDAAFHGLPDYPWPPHYISDLPALDGLRLHYVDAGPAAAARAWLLLHDSPLWSYAFRHLIHALVSHGQRVIAPDLPGFGKSDKLKRERADGLAWRAGVLRELTERLGLEQTMLVGQGLGSRLAQQLLAHSPSHFTGVLQLDPLVATDPGASLVRAAPVPDDPRAWAAPFPNAGYKAALRSEALTQPVRIPTHQFNPWPGRTFVVRIDARGHPTVCVLDAHGVEGVHPPSAWLCSAEATSAVIAQTLALLARD